MLTTTATTATTHQPTYWYYRLWSGRRSLTCQANYPFEAGIVLLVSSSPHPSRQTEFSVNCYTSFVGEVHCNLQPPRRPLGLWQFFQMLAALVGIGLEPHSVQDSGARFAKRGFLFCNSVIITSNSDENHDESHKLCSIPWLLSRQSQACCFRSD